MFALTLVAGLGLSASASRAMITLPGPQAVEGSPIIRVEGGCGPGGHRDRFGYCRPNYAPPMRFYAPPARFYAPPMRFYAPPARFYRCPPYTHPTPYGCRRNY